MTATAYVLWFITLRAVVGVPLLYECGWMLHTAWRDQILVGARAQDRMVRRIVGGYRRDALFFAVLIGLLTGTAWLQLTVILRRGLTYEVKQAVGAGAVLLILLLLGLWKWLRIREYVSLVRMAREEARAKHSPPVY